MNKSLKTLLIVVGIALIAYGLYTMFSPDAVIDAGPISIEASDNSVSTQTIVVLVLGALALAAALFAKKK